MRLDKESLREPTAENDLWADLLKNYNLPEDTEYVDFVLLEDVKKELTKQVEQILEQERE